MSEEVTQEEHVPDDGYKAEIQAQFRDLIQAADNLRRKLDALNVERGVPIKHTQTRLTNGLERLMNAQEYWEYDVINGHGTQTKAEIAKQETYELS